MDDFNMSSLHESRNEWSARLITILTPLIIDGYKSILDEAIKLCKENGEMEKYLMTFQNFISRIPKWNSAIIETERKRICEKSGCSYLEDLITCVHIIQLKILTAMRVGQKQKKIDINIPNLDDFIHKAYTNVARKIYKNVYLFEIHIAPLQMQKNNRELEIIVQEAILNTLRENIPVEAILKAYMDETVEEDVIEEVKEQIIDEPIEKPLQHIETTNANNANNATNTSNSHSIEDVTHVTRDAENTKLRFNDVDYISEGNGKVTSINAPKTLERLQEISDIKEQRRTEEDDNIKLRISDQPIHLDMLDIHTIEEPKMDLLPDLLIDDIEILD
jgi:hypothetical protein